MEYALIGAGSVLALIFGGLFFRELRDGNQARALLDAALKDIEHLEKENKRLRSPIKTQSERQNSAAAELAERRRLSENSD